MAETWEEPVEYDPTPEKLLKDEKKMKKVVKEGGECGVEIVGAADMFGLQFFCTAVDEPMGDPDWLYESMRAMNATADPNEEERKGGSGHIGKMIISTDEEKSCAVVAYVPKKKTDQITAAVWLMDVLKAMNAPESSFISGNANLAKACIKEDKDKDLFPLKLKDEGIQQSVDYLRNRGLFPDSAEEEEEKGDEDAADAEYDPFDDDLGEHAESTHA